MHSKSNPPDVHEADASCDVEFICAAYKCETARIRAKSAESAVQVYAREFPEVSRDGKFVNYKQGDSRDISIAVANTNCIIVYRLTYGWNLVCDLPHEGDVIVCKACGSTNTVTFKGYT